MEASVRPIEGDCPSNALDRGVVLACLMGNQAQQMPRVRLVRLDGEHLPVDLLGSLQLLGR